MPMSSFSFSLPETIERSLQTESGSWRSGNKIERIWAKNADVWTGADESNWLGWLDSVDKELAGLDKYRAIVEDMNTANFTDILLMGMGGSSLCPEVLALTFDKQNFHILDSTVPSQVRSVESRIDVGRTLFIVASKSGSTLEPNCFKQYFFERVAELKGRENAGSQFIAITDPGSKMEKAAKDDGFRHIIYGDPTIGGRFSALSPFGMTAGAVMGLDLELLLTRAKAMAGACRNADPDQNPGALLGLILGLCHRAGRDKLTFFLSPELIALGAWLEQLIAESTGKSGVAIIPIDREELQPAVSYGSDRVFVQIKLADTPDVVDLAELFAAGHPVMNIDLSDPHQIAAEFFRWEFATAVAGSVMDINPFDQPDVESAKIEARKLTDEYERTGELPPESPFFTIGGLSLFSSDAFAERLLGMTDEETLEEILSAHFATVGDGDYFAVLGYLEMNHANRSGLEMIRTHVLTERLAATCLGFGPRFLHSTGQAYKGGANNGVFLQITCDDAADLAVPGQKFTFGVVKAAQSRGDFQVLLDRGRRALRVHLSGPDDLDELVRAVRAGAVTRSI